MPFTTATATITHGNSLSTSVDCKAGTPWRLSIPDQWMPAPVVLLVSTDNVTFNPLLDKYGDVVVLPAMENHWINLTAPVVFPTIGYLRIQSGTQSAPVAQDNGDMVITVVLQSLDKGAR